MEQSPVMKLVVFVAVLGVSVPIVAAAQTRQAAPRGRAAAAPAPPAPAPAPDKTAEAYAQFLAAHAFADQGNLEGAIAAYRRAMTLDPLSADRTYVVECSSYQIDLSPSINPTAGILLNLTPGSDTMYVLGRSISQGKKAGIYSALGIGAGCIVHILLATFGLSIIIRESRLLFDI